MRLRLFEIICAIFALSSCHSVQKENNLAETKIIVEIDGSKGIRFSDIFEQVEYIPLETTDSSLIGTVERLRIFDDQVCLLCDKSLLIFNKQTGHAELQISKLGGAPEEYQSLYDVYIDKETKQIELLDMNGKKIQKYSLNGQYKGSLPLPFMSFSFTKRGETDYWFYNNNLLSDKTKSKVIHWNTKKESISDEFFPIDSHLSNFFFVVEGNNFANTEDGLFFFSNPPEKIYLMDNKLSPKATYMLDFGKHTIPDDFYTHNFSDIMDFSTEANKREYVYFINNFSINKECVLLSFFLDKKCFWSIYTITDGVNHVGNTLEDDVNLLSGTDIDNLNTLFATDKEALYFLLSSDQFIEMCRNNDKFSKMIINNNITDQSNPLLVKCTFKKKLQNI